MAFTQAIALKAFNRELNKFVEKTEEDLLKATKAIARKALDVVVDLSPSPGKSPYSMGSFVSSNKVGLNSPDNSFNMYAVPKLNAAVSAKISGRAQLAGLQPYNHVYISNSVPHALIVEYVGWSKRAAYMPYLKTIQAMEAIYMPQILGVY